MKNLRKRVHEAGAERSGAGPHIDDLHKGLGRRLLVPRGLASIAIHRHAAVATEKPKNLLYTHCRPMLYTRILHTHSHTQISSANFRQQWRTHKCDGHLFIVTTPGRDPSKDIYTLPATLFSAPRLGIDARISVAAGINMFCDCEVAPQTHGVKGQG